MAYRLRVTSGLRLVWRTKVPFTKGHALHSSVISFLDSEWRLALSRRNRSYCVYLSKITAWGDLQPFEATTWIHAQDTRNLINCTSKSVTSTSQYIWGMSETELPEKIPEFEDEDELTIVCVLHDVIKETKNQSIQATLEFPTELEGLSHNLGDMLQKGAIPDVELKCKDKTLRAHRAVLAARSEFFSAMFRNNMPQSRIGVVDLPDHHNVLELLLKYVYCGRISEIPADLLPSLYKAADKYAVLGLKKACTDSMTRGLTEENCIGYLVLADAHSDVDFKDEVVRFIADNKQVLDSEAWFKCTEEHSKVALDLYHICFKKWFSE